MDYQVKSLCRRKMDFVEKRVNAETDVKVVYKRTVRPVSTLLVRNKLYIPELCFCVYRYICYLSYFYD